MNERRTRDSIFGLFAYMLPTELPSLVFGLKKCGGGRGRSTVPIHVQISWLKMTKIIKMILFW